MAINDDRNVDGIDVAALTLKIERQEQEVRERFINQYKIKTQAEEAAISIAELGRKRRVSDEDDEQLCYKIASRPVSLTPKICTAICKRIANGDSLNEICGECEFPAFDIVDGWLHSKDAEYEHFQEKFKSAFETLVRLIEWKMFSVSRNAGKSRDVATIAAAKMEFDSAKQILRALSPQKWGEKQSSAANELARTLGGYRPNVVINLVTAPAAKDSEGRADDPVIACIGA